MIKIVFHAGTHGNYVEFVLNKLIAGNQIEINNPLGELGTSHYQRTNKNYLANKTFCCYAKDHDQIIKTIEPEEFFIKIDFEPEDDVTVMQLNFKRGEDYNIDPDTLHVDTYQKLFGKHGNSTNKEGPHKLIDCINQFTSLEPYYRIKDPLWPNIISLEEFYQLPTHILEECQKVFGYTPIYIDSKNPHAPKWVLRSIFKEWFQSGLVPSSEMNRYNCFSNVYKLNLRNLYHVSTFQEEIKKISDHFNLKINIENFNKFSHQEFINRVPYQNSKQKCLNIIEAVIDNRCLTIDQTNSIEQAYIDFILEKKFNIAMPIENENYFINTKVISNYIRQKQS